MALFSLINYKAIGCTAGNTKSCWAPWIDRYFTTEKIMIINLKNNMFQFSLINYKAIGSTAILYIKIRYVENDKAHAFFFSAFER